MTAENLQTLLESLQGSVGNAPSVPTSETHVQVEDATDDAEQASNKRQRTDTTPDSHPTGPSESESSMPTDPKIIVSTKETNTHDPYVDFNFDFETAHSHPESSSGARFEAGSSSGAGFSEHDEAAMRYTTEKRKFIEQSDSDEDMDMDIDVAKLQRRLEKRFENEFIDKEDEQFNVGRPEQTAEERAAARAAANAEHEAGLNAYLAVEPKKKKKRNLLRNKTTYK
ncbi:hypothetical protein Hanom_Chr17g01590481 [Helianthus anomalus]